MPLADRQTALGGAWLAVMFVLGADDGDIQRRFFAAAFSLSTHSRRGGDHFGVECAGENGYADNARRRLITQRCASSSVVAMATPIVPPIKQPTGPEMGRERPTTAALSQS